MEEKVEKLTKSEKKFKFVLSYVVNEEKQYKTSSRKYGCEANAIQAAQARIKELKLINIVDEKTKITIKVEKVPDKKADKKQKILESLKENEIFVERHHIIRKDKQYSVEEILSQFTYDEEPIDIDGDLMRMCSHRYENFLKHGVVCVNCGLEGKYFYKERYKNDTNYHFNLYAINKDGYEVLMTKDHIIPKSLGGPNSIDNYQPMCSPCNSNKGSKI